MSNQITGWIAAGLAILGTVLGVGMKWGALEQRITAIEQQQRYLHGTIHIPQGE